MRKNVRGKRGEKKKIRDGQKLCAVTNKHVPVCWHTYKNTHEHTYKHNLHDSMYKYELNKELLLIVN